MSVKMRQLCICLTQIQETPTTINDAIAKCMEPIWWASIAKKFVLTKYPSESGMKMIPNCHFYSQEIFKTLKNILGRIKNIWWKICWTSGFDVSISHIGRHGSRVAIAVVDTNIAVTIFRMIGSERNCEQLVLIATDSLFKLCRSIQNSCSTAWNKQTHFIERKVSTFKFF